MACRRGARCVPRRRRRPDRASRRLPAAPRRCRDLGPQTRRRRARRGRVFWGDGRPSWGCRRAAPCSCTSRRRAGLWQQLPAVVRSRDSEVVRAAAAAVLHVVDEAVARLAEGYNDARRQMVQVGGDAAAGVHRRPAARRRRRRQAGGAGRALRPRHGPPPPGCAGRTPRAGSNEAEAAISSLERAVVRWAGDRDVLVATKDGWIVVLTPADTDVPGPRTGREDARRPHARRARRGSRAAGPGASPSAAPYPGSYGIARSYEEAREGLTMAVRLRLDSLTDPGRAAADLPGAAARPARHRRPRALGPGSSWCMPAAAPNPSSTPSTPTSPPAGRHRDGAPTAPVRARRHLPPRPDQDPHRIRPRRPRPALHRPRRRARREAAGLAAPRPRRRPVAAACRAQVSPGSGRCPTPRADIGCPTPGRRARSPGAACGWCSRPTGAGRGRAGCSRCTRLPRTPS